ncbi:MAG: lamin tail domain-containing protein [Chloroflexota bacterium]|nr:lamin tail domain-containing protein [Chloroflexota bacterium]
MRSKRWILGICVVILTSLLAACGEQTPDGSLDKLLLYEVYTNATQGGLQWVELYNNSDEEIKLTDWKLVTSKGEVTLNGTMASPAKAGPRRFVVTNSIAPLIEKAYTLQTDAAATDEDRAKIKRLPASLFQEDKTLMGKLDPENEVVVLKKGNEIVDQVGWGNITAELKNRLGITNDVHLNQSAPKGADISLGRTPNGGVFPSGGLPGYFTIHNTPSPGIGVPKPDSRYNFFLGTITDIIAGIGGLVIWLVFILIALIARRFQVLAEQKTFWEWLMAAPIGIAIYDVILVWNYITEKNLTAPLPSWTGFGFLFLSGVACLYVINIFRLVAKNILESE